MDGVLIIDKPKDYTSHDIVNIVRKELNIKKVGHTGTLDPNATGVLPILIGKATKISKYLIEHNKRYRATLTLGKQTDTGDATGVVIKEDTIYNNINNISEEEILGILKNFQGKMLQKPPMYSAIKVNGKKAYEYAREGQTIDLKPREIEIYEIDFIKKINNKIIFEVLCSKGTYIRKLCEDIANALGTIGYMENLRRTEVDKFSIVDAVTLEEIKEKKDNLKIIDIESIFENKEKIKLDNNKLKLFLNGVQLSFNKRDGVYRIYNNENFIGLGTVENQLLKRDIII